MALIEGTTTKPKRTIPRRPRTESPSRNSSSAERSQVRSESASESGGTSTPAASPPTRPSAPSVSTPTERTPSSETSSSGTQNSNSAYDRGYDFSVGDIDFQRYDGEAGYTDEAEVEETGPDTTQYVEIDGQLVHPSDVHLHNLAPEETGAAEETGPDTTQYVEIDGQLVHPSDVHLHNLAPEETVAAEEPEAPAEDEPFVLEAGDPDNPYANHNATAVEVTPWDGTGGQPNDHIEGILLNQGYTVDEIYAPDENGQTLVDQVAGANELDDPNIIHPGQSLVVPTTAPPSPPLEDTYVNEGFPGENPDDLISEGTDQNENFRVDGLAGDDFIDVYAEGGNDDITIAGGSGQDSIYLDAGAGTDQATIDAGTGNDEIIYQGSSQDFVWIDGGEGRDVTTIHAEQGAEVSFDEESGENTVVVDGDSEIALQNVEQVIVVNAEGEEMHYIQTEDGELEPIDPYAVAV